VRKNLTFIFKSNYFNGREENIMDHSVISYIKMVGAAAGAALAGVFGGADALLWALLFCIVVDYLTGVAKAIYNKELNSHLRWRGGLKKILILAAVALGVVIDSIVTPEQGVLRALVMGYYIAMEGLSILENIGNCGVPYHPQLKKILEQLKQKNESQEEQ
jgi:toxin secretion/phage lysis holin